MHDHVHLFGASVLGIIGTASAAVGHLFAQAPTSTDIGPWLQTGGIGVTVTVLGYIARSFIKGELISHPIAEELKELEIQRDAWKKVAEDSMNREEAFRTMIVGNQFRGGQH